MVLQAFVDDSGSHWQSNVFVLAGFVATAGQWDAFQKDWQTTLNLPPKMAYFKSNEAYGLKGEFSPSKGWTWEKVADRVVALARVIRKHLPEKFSVVVSPEDYYAFVQGIPVAKRMKTLENPYFMTFYEFMIVVGGVHSLSPQVEPCEFVFDNQGAIGSRAREWWPKFMEGLPNANFDFTPYYAGPPNFGDDKHFVQLQAADLFAGQLQRVMRSRLIQIPPTPALHLIWPIAGLHRVMDTRHLNVYRNHFMGMAKRIDANDPSALPYELGRKTKRRTA